MSVFSVLICTYNRPDVLEIALKALIDQTDEKPDQVVIVNGGDERSDSIVQRYMDKTYVTVKLVKTVNKNLAASRNVGLPYCTGDIVAWTDDDAKVFPDWVTQMKRVHVEHPEAGGVGGAVLGADSSKSLLSRIADVATFSSPPQPGYVRTIAGVNVSYKREVLQAVGSQDETLFRGEDVDFNWRIKKLGYEIYYAPDIKVLHYHRPNLKQFIYQFYMYGRAYYLVRRKWPEMYCVYPHGIKSLRDLLKFIYFSLVSTVFDPFASAIKMSARLDRVLALPVGYALHIAWKSGMIVQKLRYYVETL
jgi:GT2 family glycosyltransferase